MNSAAVLRHDAPEPAVPAVRLRGFSRAFGAVRILDNLDLEMASGEFVAILGRSGSGKTTLLRALGGLDDVRDQDIMVPSSRATVFQDARLLPWKRVWQNVTLGIGRSTARVEAESALGEVGLSHRLDAWPSTLSGGEAQRVALARALIRNPGLLLLDEPFAALDALTRIKMHGLVMQLWNMHNPSIVLVTHDIEEAVTLADRVLVLREGRFAYEVSLPVRQDDSRSLDPTLKAKLIDEIG